MPGTRDADPPPRGGGAASRRTRASRSRSGCCPVPPARRARCSVHDGEDPRAEIVVRGREHGAARVGRRRRCGSACPDVLTSDGARRAPQIARRRIRVRGLVRHLGTVRRLSILLLGEVTRMPAEPTAGARRTRPRAARAGAAMGAGADRRGAHRGRRPGRAGPSRTPPPAPPGLRSRSASVRHVAAPARVGRRLHDGRPAGRAVASGPRAPGRLRLPGRLRRARGRRRALRRGSPCARAWRR